MLQTEALVDPILCWEFRKVVMDYFMSNWTMVTDREVEWDTMKVPGMERWSETQSGGKLLEKGHLAGLQLEAPEMGTQNAPLLEAHRAVARTWDRLDRLVRCDYCQMLHCEGTKSGRLPAWLLKRERTPVMNSLILLDGSIARTQTEINSILRDHLRAVYDVGGTHGLEQARAFLYQMPLP
ncbi:hypothetical protein NDU88_007753 [Pleurodeles waltl]|uniref:Uncharacterized protein n=1 Tax=Pleurodeles waltl TaxID=8319 RepID=A0AAV7VUQ4_PLEWA|nr:hypothetical protein NDU88_007753 [Pleurodeles waltl]